MGNLPMRSYNWNLSVPHSFFPHSLGQEQGFGADEHNSQSQHSRRWKGHSKRDLDPRSAPQLPAFPSLEWYVRATISLYLNLVSTSHLTESHFIQKSRKLLEPDTREGVCNLSQYQINHLDKKQTLPPTGPQDSYLF